MTLCFWLVEFGLADWVSRTAGKAVLQLNAGVLLPGYIMQQLWTSFAVWLSLTWYQPLLLRLPLWRGLVWLCAPLIAILIFQTLEFDNWLWTAYNFALAVSPVVALVGERKRWWVIVPAAAFYAAIAMYGGWGVWFGNLVYAAVLLFGSRKTSAPQPAAADE